MNDNGIQKAAILMLALGESEAAEVMKFLGPREVLKLGAAMATMKAIAHEQVVEVLEDFRLQTATARVRETGDLWKPLLAARGRFKLDHLV